MNNQQNISPTLEAKYMAQVTEYPESFPNIPVEYRTYAVSFAAMKSTGSFYDNLPCHQQRILFDVPTEHKTEELCMAAVMKNPHMLEGVPDNVIRLLRELIGN